MIPQVALCADEASLRHPELMGLAGECLPAQPWLRLFSYGEQARVFLKSDRTVDEVWVVSCEDVEPINLAATIKGDRRALRVCLVSFQGTGSLLSRASAAGIDATLTRQSFVTRYAAFKRVRAGDARVSCTGQAGRAGLPDAPGVSAEEAACAPQAPTPGSRLAGGGAVIAAGAVEPASDAAKRAAIEALHAQEPAARPRSTASAPARPGGAPAASCELPQVKELPFQAAPAVSSGAFLLPVVSGSGGSGKSTVAVLAASAAQQRGYKTLLLDFDLQFGDMRDMAGQPEALGIDDVLENPARIAQLGASEAALSVLGAPRHLEDAESVVAQAPALLDALRQRFDVVVANTGASWAEQHAVLLERCSKALFLIDQRASSLRACKRALDLCARCGIAASPFLFAVNFCAKGAPLTSIDVSCALRGADTRELADGGAEVDDVLTEGRPLDLLEAGNPLAESVAQLLADILPAKEGAQGAEPAGRGAFRRFGRRKRRKRGAL